MHDDELARTEGLPARTPAPRDADGGLAPGTRLGRYRIEERVGRGGMGEVYRAEQLEPVRRTVALKRLDARRLDARHLAYFEVERQLLAQMRHPAIAQVFDAGTTPDGHPYFAMEYIEGLPLTTYCERRGLPLRDRLELFAQVCAGVQHAHQKGVVHRDLKPGNILVADVDGRPLPKIIDFGIATAASRSRAAGAGGEALEHAGTPDYMSPEQAGEDGVVEIDTRSDVYSLGVLLFELLAGRRPAIGDDTGRVRTGAAPARPPSEQIATLAPGVAEARAAQLGVSRARLWGMLRSELDWIVLKAMQRDRAQRYASAAELADDLRRFLADQPVTAVPPSRRYAAGKFLRRHRLGLSAAAAVALAVLAGLAASLYGLQQAREQRALAERRSAELERVAAFQQSMLEGIDIEAMGSGLASGLRGQLEKTAPDRLEALDRVLGAASPPDLARRLVDGHVLAGARAAIDRDFADQPALAASLRESVADVQAALGLAAESAALYAQVADHLAASHGAGHRDTLRVRTLQAQQLGAAGDAKAALPLLEDVLARARALPDGDDVRVKAELEHASTVFALGDRPKGRALQQALLEREGARREVDDPVLQAIQNGVAISMGRMGELGPAREIVEALYVRRRERLGPEHEDTLATMSNLSVMRAMTGDLEAALSLQRERVAIASRKLGAEHPGTLAERGNLANMLLDAGQPDEAEREMRAVLEARSRLFGPESPAALRARLNLASLLIRGDRFEEGLALEQAVVDGRTRLLGPTHPDTLFIRINHAGSLNRAGRSDEALREVRAVAADARRVLGPPHPQFQATLVIEGNALRDLGRDAEALPLFRELLALRGGTFGDGHMETITTAWTLATLERDAGDPAAADALLGRYVAPLRAKPADSLTAGEREALRRIAAAEAEDGR